LKNVTFADVYIGCVVESPTCRAEAVEAEHVPKQHSEAESEESEYKLLAQGSAIIAKDSEKA